jgi:hypothetical protein
VNRTAGVATFSRYGSDHCGTRCLPAQWRIKILRFSRSRRLKLIGAMQILRRKFLHLAAGAAALSATSRIANAQAYPSRPITLIVPYPAGSAADAIARVVADGMRASLAQAIVIENIGGAEGSIVSDALPARGPTGTRLTTAERARTC